MTWAIDQRPTRSKIRYWEEIRNWKFGRTGMWMALQNRAQCRNVFVLVPNIVSSESTSSRESNKWLGGQDNSSVDTSQPLSSAAPLLMPVSHEQSGHEKRKDGYTWLQQHGLPLIDSDPMTATAECQQRRATLIRHYTAGGTSQPLGSRQMTLDERVICPYSS